MGGLTDIMKILLHYGANVNQHSYVSGSMQAGLRVIFCIYVCMFAGPENLWHGQWVWLRQVIKGKLRGGGGHTYVYKD